MKCLWNWQDRRLPLQWWLTESHEQGIKALRGKQEKPILSAGGERLAENTPLIAQTVKYLSMMQETLVWSPGGEDPLEKEMVTHSGILAWRILWAEEPGGLESRRSQRVGHDWVTNTHGTSRLSWKIGYWGACAIYWNLPVDGPLQPNGKVSVEVSVKTGGSTSGCQPSCLPRL